MEQKQISFREFLDRNINLLTIIGIFNALAIYASSIQKDDIIIEFALGGNPEVKKWLEVIR